VGPWAHGAAYSKKVPQLTPAAILEKYGPREAMEYDVVIVGAGPAGLATAIRLKQLAALEGKEVAVVVLEKGSEPGAHIVSGAIVDPVAITELFPNWRELGAPLKQEVTSDRFLFLSETGATQTPEFLLPDCFKNHGNFIVSLGDVVRWMAQQAEALGVEIFPGFAAAEVLYNDDGSVKGVATGNMGVGKDGRMKAFSSAWSCMRAIRSSPKVRAAIWANSSSHAINSTPAVIRKVMASA